MKPGGQKQLQAALEWFDNEAEVLGVTSVAVRQGLQRGFQDAFGKAVQKPVPLVQEVYTDTNAVAKEAQVQWGTGTRTTLRADPVYASNFKFHLLFEAWGCQDVSLELNDFSFMSNDVTQMVQLLVATLIFVMGGVFMVDNAWRRRTMPSSEAWLHHR